MKPGNRDSGSLRLDWIRRGLSEEAALLLPFLLPVMRAKGKRGIKPPTLCMWAIRGRVGSPLESCRVNPGLGPSLLTVQACLEAGFGPCGILRFHDDPEPLPIPMKKEQNDPYFMDRVLVSTSCTLYHIGHGETNLMTPACSFQATRSSFAPQPDFSSLEKLIFEELSLNPDLAGQEAPSFAPPPDFSSSGKQVFKELGLKPNLGG
ncbi:hypothetical protein H6P81_006098 [Aristolochia fimbriata]|uniref:Uncharacterized protein n=1 Tax=Aristolochia fimbriata TaxID=158543 RepID=A0AAV7EXE5_ARIFI|nr:hypothetical protein H6P81_006098 [Aristolochia fimbriata]